MPAPQLSKADRQALLQQLAAKRQQPRGGFDLEDSDSDGSPPASFLTARSRQPLVLEDSEGSEGEDQGPRIRASGVGGGGRLNRLRKAADTALPSSLQQKVQQAQQHQQAVRSSQYDSGDADIATALEKLTIRKQKPPAGGARQRQQSPPRGEERRQRAAAAPAPDNSQCLVLGDAGEFKLK